jgi:TolB-like protein/cytochrome c-type biogenesis protein CcmH/NrfG
LSLFNELKRRNVFRVGAAYVVAAWLLIQVAETLFPLFGFDETPARIVVILLAIGWVPSMVLAWVFELTPEGFKKEKDIDRSQLDNLQSSQKLDRVIMVVLAAALAYFAFDKFVLDPVEDVRIAESALQEGRAAALTESYGDKSIAVMPFTNLSADLSNQFFADGIHDDLLTRISNIKDIKTISRNSVMTYRNSDKSLRSIAQELRVNKILHGGVQRSGDKVRINLQLIDAVSDANVWAQTYTRELTATNVFAVQAEITEAVAGALAVILSEDERSQLEKLPTANMQALDAYFMGNQNASDPTVQSLAQAISAYQSAIRLDPEFALAYSKLGMALLDQIWFGGLPVKAQLEKSRPFIDRSILLDPQSSQAFTALGSWYKEAGETDMAEQAFVQALELGPNNAIALLKYAILVLWDKADPASAVKLLKRAVELDPQNIDNKILLAESMGHLSLTDDAISIMESVIAEHPDSANSYRVLADLYSSGKSRHDKAILALSKVYELDPENPRNSFWIGSRYYRLADFENAALWLDHAAELMPDSEMAPWYRGWASICRADFEGARQEFDHSKADNAVRWIGSFFLARIDLASGRPADAVNRYMDFAPRFDGKKSYLNFYFGVGAIHAFQESGDHGKAQALTDELLAVIDIDPPPGYHGVHILDAALYAVSGQTETAIATLEKWVSEGGSSSLLQTHTAFELGVLADDPRYRELLQTVKNRLSDQRETLARWKDSGEIPRIPKT